MFSTLQLTTRAVKYVSLAFAAVREHSGMATSEIVEALNCVLRSSG
jgi:hypothetical protein